MTHADEIEVLPDGIIACRRPGTEPLTADERDTLSEYMRWRRDRRAIEIEYAPRLKGMSASDPGYAELWNERAAKIAALRESYEAPHAAPGGHS
jgi:hypothetical protein